MGTSSRLPPLPHIPLSMSVTQSPAILILSCILMVALFGISVLAVQVQFFGSTIKGASSSSPPTASPSYLALTLPMLKQLVQLTRFYWQGGTFQPTPLTKSSLKGITDQSSTLCPTLVSIDELTYNNFLKVHNTPLPSLSRTFYGPIRLGSLTAALTIWQALPEITHVTLNLPLPPRPLL